MKKEIKNKQEKGITLIALVVTIVVLLILAGVSISLVLNNNGVISKAKDAKNQYAKAQTNEEKQLNEVLDWIDTKVGDTTGGDSAGGSGDSTTGGGSTGGSGDSTTGGGSTGGSGDSTTGGGSAGGSGDSTTGGGSAGSSGNSTTKVDGVPIPEGYYYVGGTKAKGMVISDNVADKELDKGKENVRRDLAGNQWVWVPVETPSSLYTTVDAGVKLSGNTGVKTTKYTNSEIISWTTRGLPGSTDYREPDILTDSDLDDTNYARAGFSSLANMAEKMVSDYEEMIASLEKYKGFYIGRYELTANGEKTGVTRTNVDWYTLYRNCTTLARGTKVKTRMIWGLQWDATCKWLDSSGFNITNSSAWGNYADNTATGHDSKQKTGFSESWKANNIYDFAGNCSEYTQEARFAKHRLLRGDCYCGVGSNSSASYRNAILPTWTDTDNGSRPTLYLIP